MSIVVYLAHPVAADTSDGVRRNLISARAWLRRLTVALPRVAWCASWIPSIEVALEAGVAEAEERVVGLVAAIAIAERCDGIVLVGPAATGGMRREADAVIARGGWAVDATLLPGRATSDEEALASIVRLVPEGTGRPPFTFRWPGEGFKP